MKRFLPFFILVIFLSCGAMSSYAQESEETENKGTLASMFESWNQKHREKLKKAAGVGEKEEEEERPVKEYVPPKAVIREAQGARSRIFDPVTSYNDQRRAYQQKNLANIEDMHAGRESHGAFMKAEEISMDSERMAHIRKYTDQDGVYMSDRENYLDEYHNDEASYQSRQKEYLKEYVAAHRRYLELDVEN